MAVGALVVKIEVTGVPEALYAMRHAMAERLREAADAEASSVLATKLRKLAADFEVGV